MLLAGGVAIGRVLATRCFVGGELGRSGVFAAGEVDLDLILALLEGGLCSTAAFLEIDAAEADAVGARVEGVAVAHDERVGGVGVALLASHSAIEVRGAVADRRFLLALHAATAVGEHGGRGYEARH